MKIFSLQSKWNLAGWSVVLGLAFFWLVTKFSFKFCDFPMGNPAVTAMYTCSGWPFVFHSRYDNYQAFFFKIATDFVLCLIAAFVALSLTKHFKEKKLLNH